jgi:cytochrome c-type biogenesis protein CcmH
MLRCGSADPLRRRIHQMKMTGMSDQDVINTIVQEQGAVALATPPTGTFGGVITWIMPGLALLIGFWVYAAYVKRNSKPAQPVVDENREQVIQAYIREMSQKSDDEA